MKVRIPKLHGPHGDHCGSQSPIVKHDDMIMYLSLVVAVAVDSVGVGYSDDEGGQSCHSSNGLVIFA
ncbi:unnamed protein product [Ilex paraguariensis]|uniref:Uncharacterized protein n=1 Tax=Ilex paraguariensis TaxID=185542 RepID=A0ABC8RMU7_9AQUA